MIEQRSPRNGFTYIVPTWEARMYKQAAQEAREVGGLKVVFTLNARPGERFRAKGLSYNNQEVVLQKGQYAVTVEDVEGDERFKTFQGILGRKQAEDKTFIVGGLRRIHRRFSVPL